MRKISALSVLLFLVFSSFAQSANIRGFVYEESSGEPVIFTNVKLEGTSFGASTDVNGFFSITKLPAGTYTLVISNVSYTQLKETITVKDGQVVNKKFHLKEGKQLDEFTVNTEKAENKVDPKVSVIKVSKKDIQSVVTVGGEADIATYFQTVPGVVSTGDQGGQLYVRGGAPVQNKVLLDGMVIYNPFHSIGFFSVFDTEIIRNADIYTGGFGAEYGGRVSSVMDIRTRDGNQKRTGGRIAVSPFGAKGLLEGPLKKAKDENDMSITYLLSAKTSYLEQTSKTLYRYIDTLGLPFNFTDLYGKVTINGQDGNKVNFFGFNFNDRVKYKAISNLRWDSWGAGSSFVMVPSGSKVLMQGHFNYSQYKIELEDESSAPRYSQVDGFSGGFDFKYYNGDDEIKYGVEINGFKTDFSYVNSTNATILQTQNTTELGGYFSYRMVRNLLVLEPSLRLQYYASLSNISPEPRLSAKYNITENFRIKGAGGLYSQNLIAANSDRDVVNLFYGFLSGSDNLPGGITMPDGTFRERRHLLQKATHAILGGEYDLTERLSLNIEGYVKWFNQLTNINRNKIYEDRDINQEEIFRKDYIIETGMARGVDMTLKYRNKKTYIWFVYSLGKVDRWDGLIEYAPVFDRRHNLNIVGTYLFGKDDTWEVDVRWNFGSALPFTQTQGYYHNIPFQNGIGTNITTANSNELEILYGDLNGGRLSPYHRLDISVKKQIEFNKNSKMEIVGGVTNLYNRNNIFYVDRVTTERVFQLPILPSIGISWTF
ncbi:MAG: TonB-dependent receptor [Flavobacteriales bacterium]